MSSAAYPCNTTDVAKRFGIDRIITELAPVSDTGISPFAPY
jgi:hypothetical protein